MNLSGLVNCLSMYKSMGNDALASLSYWMAPMLNGTR
jgi:hypothetical protein